GACVFRAGGIKGTLHNHSRTPCTLLVMVPCPPRSGKWTAGSTAPPCSAARMKADYVFPVRSLVRACREAADRPVRPLGCGQEHRCGQLASGAPRGVAVGVG